MKEKRLIVGRIPFLVALGFFHLDQEEEEFVYVDGTPAELNRALSEGRIDIAPASSFEFLRHSERYALLPDFCTSGITAVRSALLFSRVPWDQLSNRTISITPDSASAGALLKILLRLDSLTPSFQTGKVTAADSAQLLIGNQALIVDQQREWNYTYDLCTLWNKKEHLPFAFGAWIVRKEVIDHPELNRWRHHLARSVAAFRADPTAALRRWQLRHTLPEGDLRLDDYWKTLEYRMSDSHRAALERFAQLAFESNLLDKMPVIDYLPAMDYSPHS